MLDLMGQAKNAIEAYNTALKASSSNIANMNVTGYKKINVSFQSVFEKVLRQGTAAQGDLGGTNPMQQGQGMALSTAAIDFSAGEFLDGYAWTWPSVARACSLFHRTAAAQNSTPGPVILRLIQPAT